MKHDNGALTPIPVPKPASEPGLSFDRAAVLAGTVATPFLVLTPSRIHQSIRTLRTCLPGVELYYATIAVQADPDTAVGGHRHRSRDAAHATHVHRPQEALVSLP